MRLLNLSQLFILSTKPHLILDYIDKDIWKMTVDSSFKIRFSSMYIQLDC